ncbi:MAG: hypothetical protein DBY17_01545 [Oscillospiraceae bacterium]|nr:MAG: hypothetical protein DBY17_01545 [Oscillospiraceae bacterium]
MGKYIILHFTVLMVHQLQYFMFSHHILKKRIMRYGKIVLRTIKLLKMISMKPFIMNHKMNMSY